MMRFRYWHTQVSSDLSCCWMETALTAHVFALVEYKADKSGYVSFLSDWRTGPGDEAQGPVVDSLVEAQADAIAMWEQFAVEEGLL